MISPDEREHLYLLARGLEPGSNVVEIGCYAGLSTYFLGMGTRKSDSYVFSIDPFYSDIGRQRGEDDGSEYLRDGKRKPSLSDVMGTMEKYGLQDIVTLIEGFSHDVVTGWDKLIMLLFIDGNHRYEEVLKDYQDWSRFIPEGGIISFHDSNPPRYGFESVARVVREVIVPPTWEIIERVDSITTGRRCDF